MRPENEGPESESPESPFPKRLRLRSVDAHDLLILGSCVQDALVPVIGMDFDASDQSFILLLNRFMWEVPPIEDHDHPHYYRVHSGLRFSKVVRAHYQGIDFESPEKILNLLTIRSEDERTLTLLFSGDGSIRLEVDQIEAYLFDLEEPWLTPAMPEHFLDKEGRTDPSYVQG